MDRTDTRAYRFLRRMMRYLLPMVGALLVGMIYYLGIYSERTGFVDQVLDPGLKRITEPVLNAFRGKPPMVLELNIHMEEPERDSLLIVREQALDEGWLGDRSSSFFTATVIHSHDSATGRVALLPGKGDRFQGDRWPFRVILDGPDTVIGMRSFTMMAVTDLSALHAISFQWALEGSGIPTFGVAFADIRLNDRDLGLYFLEGGLDSSLFDHWGRGAGTLLRFDDELLRGLGATMDASRYPKAVPMQGEWFSAPILVDRRSDAIVTPSMAGAERSALRSLEEFRAGRMAASAVFDVDHLAKLLALCDLFGGQGSMSWWNIRVLADNSAGKLIILPMRYIAGFPITEPLALKAMGRSDPSVAQTDLLDRLLNDPLVLDRYLAFADSFSSEGWLEDSQEQWSSSFEVQLRIMRAELPQLEYDPHVLLHNRDVIRTMLHPKDLALAYSQARSGMVTGISLANVHALSIRATRIIAGADTVTLREPIVLKPRERSKPLNYTLLRMEQGVKEGTDLQIEVGVVGLDEPRFIKIRSWSMIPAQ